MRSCIFSIITPVFSVTWSSEIIIIYWFTAQQTVLIILNVENSRSALYFCVKHEHFIFRIIWWIENSKGQHLFETEIICNFINIFTTLLINLMHPFWIKVFICSKKSLKMLISIKAVYLKPNRKLWASEHLVDVTVLPVRRNGQQTHGTAESWDTRPSLSRNMRRDVRHTEIPDTRLSLPVTAREYLTHTHTHTHTRTHAHTHHTHTHTHTHTPTHTHTHTAEPLPLTSSHRSSHSRVWVMFTRTSLMSHADSSAAQVCGAWLKTGHTLQPFTQQILY